jgi:hypothetical protein
MAPRTSYPLPAQHLFTGLDAWRMLILSDHGGALPGPVIAACAAKLADFKVPRQVTVVAALPRSTISKVNKAALRLCGQRRSGGGGRAELADRGGRRPVRRRPVAMRAMSTGGSLRCS